MLPSSLGQVGGKECSGLPLPMIAWRTRIIHAQQAADREVMQGLGLRWGIISLSALLVHPTSCI
jgi:hypothetical protein